MATPRYIYETLDLYRFAHFNPDIETFAKPIRVPDQSNVIGYCMPWWEGREENWHTMMLPRVIPMADVAWNGANRDADRFELRQRALELEREKYFCPIKIESSPLHIPDDLVFHEKVNVSLSSHFENEGQIRFTIDGSPPTSNSQKYSSKIELKQSTNFRAAMFASDGEQIGHGLRRNFSFVDVSKVNPRNVAFGKPVTSSASSAAPFSSRRITDGGVNPLKHYLGYPAMPKPIELTIDLGQPNEIDTVVVHAASNSGSWESYTVQTSLDGANFESVADRSEKPESPSVKTEHEFNSQPARYVRILTNGNKGHVFDAFSRIAEVEVLSGKKQ
jgi:hexosaminidase